MHTLTDIIAGMSKTLNKFVCVFTCDGSYVSAGKFYTIYNLTFSCGNHVLDTTQLSIDMDIHAISIQLHQLVNINFAVLICSLLYKRIHVAVDTARTQRYKALIRL